MTPFQAFRAWLRRAPVGERSAAGLASAAAVAALVWLLVPAGTGSTNSALSTGGGAVASGVGGTGSSTGAGGQSQGAASGASQAGGSSSPATGTSGGGLGPGSASAGSSGAPAGSAPAGAGSAAGPGGGPTGGSGTSPVVSVPSPKGGGGHGCVSPPVQPGTRGVTASTIKIAVSITNIGGPVGNETFGGQSPAASQADVQDIVDSINAAGGVACRKLQPVYYQSNPVDQSNMQQVCLEIVADGDFADIDQGGESVSPGPQCFGQNHIPYFDSANLLSVQAVSQYYPYLFVPFATFDSLYHNTALALRDRGFFSRANGFSKLGFVYLDCYPQAIATYMSSLHQAGLTDSQIVTYDIGCPATSIAGPNDLEAAILKFQQNGVTHVTTGDMAGGFSNFTTIAQQQGFKPKYGIPDEAVVAISYGSQHPDYNNVVGALAVTPSRYGESTTPGIAPYAPTALCDSYFVSHGRPTLYKQGVIIGANNGAMCDEMWMFKSAVEHSAVISQSSLGAGLQAAKSVPFSYPFSPNDFSGNRITYGGQFWRVDQWIASCNCWQVVDQTFHPSYP